jgi:hypothetical protein
MLVVAVLGRDLHGKSRATISPFIGAIRAFGSGKLTLFAVFSNRGRVKGELALQLISM